MSATKVEPVEAAVEQPDLPDDLFHSPANDAEDWRAANGLSWVTLCGTRRPPAREMHEFGVFPDDCVVCLSLEEAAWEDES